jgi:hypothetical protein
MGRRRLYSSLPLLRARIGPGARHLAKPLRSCRRLLAAAAATTTNSRCHCQCPPAHHPMSGESMTCHGAGLMVGRCFDQVCHLSRPAHCSRGQVRDAEMGRLECPGKSIKRVILMVWLLFILSSFSFLQDSQDHPQGFHHLIESYLTLLIQALLQYHLHTAPPTRPTLVPPHTRVFAPLRLLSQTHTYQAHLPDPKPSSP